MSMERRTEIFWELISLLNQKGLLPHLILIGSWAEYLYSQTILPGYQQQFVTSDLDILILNINRPVDDKGLPQTLSEYGYLVTVDRLNNTTKFFKEGELEIEFLTTVKGSGHAFSYHVPSLVGVTALGIRNLDLLAQYRIPLEVGNYTINVPKPQIYILHKLLINKDRKEKKIKDLMAVRNLLLFIQQDPPQIEELRRIYSDLTKKQQTLINQTCESEDVYLF